MFDELSPITAPICPLAHIPTACDGQETAGCCRKTAGGRAVGISSLIKRLRGCLVKYLLPIIFPFFIVALTEIIF